MPNFLSSPLTTNASSSTRRSLLSSTNHPAVVPGRRQPRRGRSRLRAARKPLAEHRGPNCYAVLGRDRTRALVDGSAPGVDSRSPGKATQSIAVAGRDSSKSCPQPPPGGGVLSLRAVAGFPASRAKCGCLCADAAVAACDILCAGGLCGAASYDHCAVHSAKRDRRAPPAGPHPLAGHWCCPPPPSPASIPGSSGAVGSLVA